MVLRFDAFLRRQHARDIPYKGLLIIDKAHEKKYRTLPASSLKAALESLVL